jgi:hypothetical protein
MQLKHVRLFGAGYGTNRKSTTLESFEVYKSMLKDYFNKSSKIYGINTILLCN